MTQMTKNFVKLVLSIEKYKLEILAISICMICDFSYKKFSNMVMIQTSTVFF